MSSQELHPALQWLAHGMLLPVASGSGDAARAASDSDDDSSVGMRLTGLEGHNLQLARSTCELNRDLDRMGCNVEDLHQHRAATIRIVHELQNEVEHINGWKQWLTRLRRWAVSSMRSFPWP